MMVFEHDYKNYPELTQKQIDEFGFTSPHKQITEDFEALVVKVHDGDTITLRADFRDFDFPMRLMDIDAPELNAGGQEAREWLKERIQGIKVTIKIAPKNKVEKYGRLLGKVFDQGLDVGDEMLRMGIVTTFEDRREGQLPSIEKIFAVKQWL